MRFITAVLINVLIFSSLAIAQTGPNLERERRVGGQFERRIALVIGNGAYAKTKSLANPANDAADMAKALKDVGFEVLSGVNQSKRQMESLIREFGAKLVSGGTGLFYYAGHGLQVGGSNYLVPVDAEIPEEDEVEYQTVPLDLVLTKMTTAKNDLNIVILDACRNNPFARSWRGYRDSGNNDGLAKISPPTGTLVLYATEPGKVASDGAGRNGLFTESLLRHIKRPNVEYDQMVKALSADVWQRSNRQQLPWKEGNSLSEFYFIRGGTATAKLEPAKGDTVAEKDKATVEREVWGYIRNSVDPQDFRDFLREFPSGANAGNARMKLEQAVWDSVKDSGDRTRIQAYLSEFPSGANLPLARMKLRELDVPTVPAESGGGNNWVSMSASSSRNLETLSAAVERGEEAVINIKYNTLDSGARNWLTRPESGSGSVYLASGKVRISKAGVDFDFTYGLDDFGVTPDKILDVVNEPHQNARIHVEVAVKNKKGNKESIKDFYFYSPGSIVVGTGPGGVGDSVSCNACDDSMSVLFALLQKVRASAKTLAAPPSVSAPPAGTKLRTAAAAILPSLIVDLDNGVKMEFVVVQAGSFQMGGDKYYEGHPVHGVTISSPFYLGKYEVTQSQWQAVMGNNPSKFKDCGGNCPVENVMWDDAQEFIKRLNARGDGQTYRLPTEAEWEYAARAGTTGAYAGNLDAMAWYGNNSGNSKLDADKIDSSNYHKRLADNGNKTHPVGTKQPNAWGLYDMHGNVWEWCQDWFAEYSGIPAIDPSGPVSGERRVARGGSWSSFASNERSAYRFSWPPNLGGYPFGLRVVAVARIP